MSHKEILFCTRRKEGTTQFLPLFVNFCPSRGTWFSTSKSKRSRKKEVQPPKLFCFLWVVRLNHIPKKEVEDISSEINTAKCDNPSHESFLLNNDLNVTGACLDADFSRTGLLSLCKHRPPSGSLPSIRIQPAGFQ